MEMFDPDLTYCSVCFEGSTASRLLTSCGHVLCVHHLFPNRIVPVHSLQATYTCVCCSTQQVSITNIDDALPLDLQMYLRPLDDVVDELCSAIKFQSKTLHSAIDRLRKQANESTQRCQTQTKLLERVGKELEEARAWREEVKRLRAENEQLKRMLPNSPAQTPPMSIARPPTATSARRGPLVEQPQFQLNIPRSFTPMGKLPISNEQSRPQSSQQVHRPIARRMNFSQLGDNTQVQSTHGSPQTMAPPQKPTTSTFLHRSPPHISPNARYQHAKRAASVGYGSPSVAARPGAGTPRPMTANHFASPSLHRIPFRRE